MDNKLNRALRIDGTILSVARGKFSHICVQIDLRKPLISFISVLGYLQKVEYEVLYVIFSDCGAYGYRK